MNLTLSRNDYREDGIFGIITDEASKQIAVSLEHAYDSGNGDGSYAPKVPAGVYKCVRGQHRLASMKQNFTTFEVTNVPGHTNILFHTGNYNHDSEGCILLGRAYGGQPRMIEQSKMTFEAFMALQDGVDQFTLTVKDGN